MKIIAGLGNPGKKYRDTRHNVGFDVLDRMVGRFAPGDVKKSRFEGLTVTFNLQGENILLLWPLTFMNRSGRSVAAAVSFYRIEPADLIVVCDEMNLPLGKLRFRRRGTAGGQKGMANVIQCLRTEEISRLRIGVGKPHEHFDHSSYLLSRFPVEERPEVDLAIDKAAQALEDWIEYDTDYCMNAYN